MKQKGIKLVWAFIITLAALGGAYPVETKVSNAAYPADDPLQNGPPPEVPPSPPVPVLKPEDTRTKQGGFFADRQDFPPSSGRQVEFKPDSEISETRIFNPKTSPESVNKGKQKMSTTSRIPISSEKSEPKHKSATASGSKPASSISGSSSSRSSSPRSNSSSVSSSDTDSSAYGPAKSGSSKPGSSTPGSSTSSSSDSASPKPSPGTDPKTKSKFPKLKWKPNCLQQRDGQQTGCAIETGAAVSA